MHGERSVVELAVYALGRVTMTGGAVLNKLVKEYGAELFKLMYDRLLLSPHTHDQVSALSKHVCCTDSYDQLSSFARLVS